MNEHSQKVLRKVQENNAHFNQLQIVDFKGCGTLARSFPEGIVPIGFFSSNLASDYSTLGRYIGQNSNLNSLTIDSASISQLVATDKEFAEGIKCNSSIHQLSLHCGLILDGNTGWVSDDIVIGGFIHDILVAYEENKSLTRMSVQHLNLRQVGNYDIITTTISRSENLKSIGLTNCNLYDTELVPMMSNLRLVEKLYLSTNWISNAGCKALATLLEDPNSNLHTLHILGNDIGNEGAEAIADSLAHNTKLRHLSMVQNPFDKSVQDSFCKVLCNTSSINHTYLSNHTLDYIEISWEWQDRKLDNLWVMNENDNKSNVAMKKILKHHTIIDMKAFFDLGAEEGEWNLKALPVIVDWFERAEKAVAGEVEENYNIEQKKLSAIYQFARTMPSLFVPPSHVKQDKKRKINL